MNLSCEFDQIPHSRLTSHLPTYRF